MKKYPQQYLHIRRKEDGQEWIRPFRSDAALDLEKMVKKWIKKEFQGELRLNGEISRPGYDLFEYYAQIMTDGRPPDSVVCWTSGGFNVTTTY